MVERVDPNALDFPSRLQTDRAKQRVGVNALPRQTSAKSQKANAPVARRRDLSRSRTSEEIGKLRKFLRGDFRDGEEVQAGLGPGGGVVTVLLHGA